MSILLYFFIILGIIRLTKLETRPSIILSIVITYLIYKSSISDTMSKLTTKIIGYPILQKDNIPDIISKEWYLYWKDYLNDIKEYNNENYIDIMKSMKHFHQLYNDIFIGVNMPNQHLDNLVMLVKEILNLMQSTIYKLPPSINEKLENILNQKILFLKEELDFRITEMRNYINKDWNEGKISYQSQPIYPNTLTSLPPDHSPNFSFY